jgi:hypothetical protein
MDKVQKPSNSEFMKIRSAVFILYACRQADRYDEVTPNYAELIDVQVKLYTLIRKVNVPILAQDTAYSDWGFSWISSVSRGKFRDTSPIRTLTLPSSFFPTHQVSSHHSTLHSLVTESVVKQFTAPNWCIYSTFIWNATKKFEFPKRNI